MAAREKPELLSGLAQYEIDEPSSARRIGSSFENRDAVRADGGEILRECKRHVAPTGNRNLGERIKINCEGVGGFAQRHVLRRG